MGVNYYLNSNSTQYFTQSLHPIVYALQNLDRNFAYLVVPPTNGTEK